MYPTPLPKWITEHPTYASWFDAVWSPFEHQGSEWINIQLSSYNGDIEFWASGILPYPEVFALPITIPLYKDYDYLLTLYYHVYLDGYFVPVGMIRMKYNVGLSKDGRTVSVPRLIQPYKSMIDNLHRKSRLLSSRSQSVRRSGYKSSAPVRPNEEFLASYPDYAEGCDQYGVYSVRIDSTMTRIKRSRIWTGVRTPNFGALKKEGKLPVNPHSVRIFEESGGVVHYHVKRLEEPLYYDFGMYHASKHYVLPVAPSHSAEASSRAFKRLAKKVGSIEANLAQDLYQYRQTVNMIADTAKRLTGAYKAVRGGNFSSALQILYHPSSSRYSRGKPPSNSNSAASNWLAIQYGWKPLLSDIHNAVELISQQNKNEEGSLQKVVASASHSHESSSSFDIVGYPGYKAGSKTSESRSTARYYLIYRQSPTLTNYLQQTGFTNPLNFAWEVLPYSFVVDWFLPIGPWLETLSLWQGKEFMTGGLTQFTRGHSSLRIDYQGTHIKGSRFVLSGRGEYIRKDVLFNRTRLTAFPTMELPRPKNPLSVTHALNALALMIVGFRKSSKLRD